MFLLLSNFVFKANKCILITENCEKETFAIYEVQMDSTGKGSYILLADVYWCYAYTEIQVLDIYIIYDKSYQQIVYTESGFLHKVVFKVSLHNCM